MMRLAITARGSQLAAKVNKPVSSIPQGHDWGNHSATPISHVFQAGADGKKIWPMINDQSWLETTFHSHSAGSRRGDSSSARAFLRRKRRQRRHRSSCATGCMARATATG